MPAEEPAASPRPDPSLPGGIPLFFLGLGILAAIRVLLGYVSFPLAWLPPINLSLAVLFLAVPIVALFFAGNANWTWKTAAIFVGGGIAVQIGIILLGESVPMPGPVAGILTAIAQAALGCWCAGLGALLATLIKEKNILLPIAIFLAAYDFFLVLTPWGFTQKLLKVAQPVFTKVAAQIPVVSAAPTHGVARAGAYVGMADLVFLAMFFIALFRFRMRTRQTLYAVLPALIAYLLIVLLLGRYEVAGFSLGQLPALVPIGLAVLIVNWREFDLKKDEKLATAVLALLAVGFLVFAATRPKPQAEPEQRAPASAPRTPAK
ncbi:MAG TPA: hypothetical protein VHE55_08295 [Fimbriimonadaceae bacterium]|nr:hypothetical protein [Fimbriimonadaceae bacterium]